jgi:hypothetical protein
MNNPQLDNFTHAVHPQIRRELRLLKTYAVVSSLLIATLLLVAAADNRKKEKLDELDVQRINFVEPDGTLRMVISNKAAFPGAIIKGKEYPHEDRKTAGILFFNEEGTENGGLIFGGSKDKDGKVQSYGHLSFDRYEQDQVFTIDASEDGPHKKSGLSVVDDPDWPLTDLLNTPKDKWQDFLKTRPLPHQRIYLGRVDDKSAVLKLKDQDGKDRIVIQVAPDGTPTLQFLDADGHVMFQLPTPAK